MEGRVKRKRIEDREQRRKKRRCHGGCYLYSGCHFLNSSYRPAGGRIPLGMRDNTSSGEVKYLLQQVFFTSNLQVFYFFSTGIVPVTVMKDFYLLLLNWSKGQDIGTSSQPVYPTGLK